MKFLKYTGIFALLLLLSCSSNDSNSNSTSDNLITGIWYDNGKYQGETFYEPSECDRQDSLELLQSFRFDEAYHSLDNSGNCFLEGHETGNWEKIWKYYNL